MSTAAVTKPQSLHLHPSAFDTIIWGGLVAGTLDAIDGVVALWFKGLNPIQVLQYIASGALGAKAFEGGLTAAAIGAGFHFLIAFSVAAAYFVGSLGISSLVARPVRWGLAYGAVVYLFMNYLVLPLTNVGPQPFSMPLFINGVVGHAFFVGLPIALFARRSAQQK